MKYLAKNGKDASIIRGKIKQLLIMSVKFPEHQNIENLALHFYVSRVMKNNDKITKYVSKTDMK